MSPDTRLILFARKCSNRFERRYALPTCSFNSSFSRKSFLNLKVSERIMTIRQLLPWWPLKTSPLCIAYVKFVKFGSSATKGCIGLYIKSVVDRGVGDWGSCPGHQGRGAPKRGEQKITRICMTKNVIDFIILNNQMFRINDIDIYNINQYSVALHWLQSLCEVS